MSDQATADVERLGLRKQTAEEFKALSGAAQDAGVQSKMFGVFHDAGYKGLYGGLGRDAIKQRKTIPDKDNLLDRMNATELAANQFRMTQTRDKLARDVTDAPPELDLADVVRRTVEVVVQQTIDIPRIAVVPRGVVKSGFKPFTLDVSGLHLQPTRTVRW